MKNNKKTPEIRFKGFTDDWEQRKLGEIVDSYSGGTPTAGKSEYYGGTIPFIRSAEVNSDTTELFLTKEGLKTSSAKMVNKGDILYALYGATSGEVGLARLDGAINQAILDIKPYEDYDAHFIMNWLRKSKENIIGTYLQGGQGNLSGTIVTSLIIDCPDYDEQKRIGEFFANLDNLITLHQRKYEKLKNIKQSLLEKMFPKNGMKIPEIRFKGFTDDWEQRKLGELGEFKSNGVDKLIKKDEVPVNLLNYMDVYNRRKINNQNSKLLMQVTAKPKQLIENNILKGDVFFTPTSETADDIGHVMVIEENLENTVYSYHLMRFRPYINAFSMLYPNYGLDISSVKEQMRLSAQGVQRFVLSKSNFETINIKLPSYSEQEKISRFLTNLDNLITLHQRKYEKLKNIKQSLLDKMFV